ncbi:MAG TPA: hypothetical protein DD457_01965 [Gammaproteobacteria bacterium]|nr:hypothetical protein [Gammaproteobacteria bacterium]
MRQARNGNNQLPDASLCLSPRPLMLLEIGPGLVSPAGVAYKNYAVFRTPVRKNLKMHQVEKAQSRCQMPCI